LSSFYQFVVRGQLDAQFTTNPIPIHKAAASYRQVYPSLRSFDPQRALEALQHISCSTPERCRDYTLLWIALTSARSPRDLLSLTISNLHINPDTNTYSLVWPEPNPRLHPVHLCLPSNVVIALLTYLCEIYTFPLESLDATLPLWVSFSTRNAGKVISAQTLADIARKHLGTASLRAFLHAQVSCMHSSQSA
jgi:hypothetical protein